MIKNIYHLADIHITNNETRHKEYEEVFNNLYNILEKDDKKKLIVICGDLFHEKNSHQNKQNIIAKDFINKITKYGELIIIDGNHDYVPHNDNSSSSIDSLLLHLEVNNSVHYLTKNKIYNIEGINFGLTTMNSNKITPIINKNPKELYVGLYHGSLYKSSTNIGWINDDETSFKISDFKDYDIVMLGDIHKFQYLNKEKTIAYSSSLIQQNFGETINNHGMIKWNVKSRKGEFIEIPNSYVYKIFRIEDINNYTIPEIENKKTRLKIIYKNKKREEIEKFKKEIYKKYSIISIRQEEQYDENNIVIKDGKLIDKSILEVYNEYLTEYKIKEDKNITNKITEYVKKMTSETSHKIKNLKLKTLEFENLFTYGTNNRINFDSLYGINIVTGSNGLGKSSIVDIILFAIFNIFSRGKGKEALNIRHNKGKVRLTLELNGEMYEITRKIIGIKTEVSLIKDGKLITSDTKNSTDENIIKIFGNYQDMIMSSIILQVGQNFIDMSEKDKRITLINILGLDIYENIFMECIREKKDTSLNKISDLNKKINDIDYKTLINKKENENNELKELLNTIENKNNNLMKEYYKTQNKIDKNILTHDKKLLENKINELNKNINEYKNKITKTDYNNYDINDCININEEILKENEIINNKINNLYTQIIKIQKININLNNITKLNKEKEELNNKIIENQKLLFDIQKNLNINENEYITQINKLETEIKLYNEEMIKRNNNLKILNILEKKNDNLLKHKFNPKCVDCINNEKIHKNIGYLKEIEEIKKEIDNFNENNDEYKNKEKQVLEIKKIIEIQNNIKYQQSKKELLEKEIEIENNKIKIEKENNIV